jgi:type VI secretion system protein ImpE
MPAAESLAKGDLDGALAELTQSVKSDPSSSKHRIFLFQLLCVMGQWDRALNQLKVLGEMDPGTIPMVQTYQEALACEALRAEVFAGQKAPLVFGDPEEWVALLIQALKLSGEGNFAECLALRDQAFEAAPTTSGKVDGEAFEWIADADTRLGPVLEAVVKGSYYWVPIHRVRSIQFEDPEDLRDVVWTPAQFTWANGGQAVGLIPTRYPGSEQDEDGLIRLARKTDWVEAHADLFLGKGQRLLATDTGEHPLMDIRLLELDTEAAEDPTSPTEDPDG